MSEKELSKNMSMLFKASWAVAALAVAMIAIVMKPDTFSFGYWLRICWIEVLTGLFFISANWLFSSKKESSAVAIAPVFGTVTVLYCIVSFSLMMFFWMYEGSNSISRFHLVIQIIALALYLLTAFMIRLSSLHAGADMKVSAEGCKLPNYYVNKISVIENSLSPELQKEMKKLREKMKYSLMNIEKIKHIPEYENLTYRLDSLLTKPNEISLDDVKGLYIDVEEIITLMKGI